MGIGNTQIGADTIASSSALVPGNVNPVPIQGSTNTTTDNQNNTSTPVNLNLKQVGDVLFALGQALKVGSIPVVLPSDQIVSVSATSLPLPTGAATQTTLASVLAQLQAGIAVNTISNYANETGGNLAASKADLDTLAGIVSSNKAAVKSAANDIADLATYLILAGAPGDANTVNSMMGRLTKIRDLLNATLTVQGTITEANSASSNTHLGNIDTATSDLVTDLDTLITNTTGLATQATLLAAKNDLDTLATNTADLLTDGDNLATINTNTSNSATVEGATNDAAVLGDVSGTLSAKLRGLSKILNALTDTFGNSTAISAATTLAAIPTTTGLVANSFAMLSNASYQDTFIVQINVASAFVGTIGFYGLLPDGSTLQQINAHQRGTATNGNSTAINTGSALEQTWEGSIAGFKALYVICSAFTSGAASVQIGLTAANYAHAILNTVAQNLTQVGGSSISLGQALKNASLPVTLASDQGNVNNASVGTDGSAIPGSSTMIGASDGTNLQQLLVESASNRNLRTGLYNGTNEAAVDSAGNQQVRGGFSEQASLSAGSLNADLVPSTDVSAYKWLALHINTNAYSGTLTFQGSNDNSNWVSVAMFTESGGTPQTSTGTTGTILEGPVSFRFFRVRMTSYTSGTAQGTLELYTASPGPRGVYAAQNGTWTVQPGNTANTTPWLINASQIGGQSPKLDNTNELGVSLYGKSTTAGDTAIKVNSVGDQYVLGDFTEQASLSAGSLNADLVASTDVSAYKWLSLHINTSAYVGTLTFQGSNDNANWTNVVLYPPNTNNASNAGSSTSLTNTLLVAPVQFRFFRVRMTSYTSGIAQGTLELYTSAPAYILSTINALQSGTWTVQPGNTANTTPWLESIHDGTNKANVLPATSVSNAIGSQGALLTGGAFAEQASLSAGSLNADLVASTDVSNYKWFSIHVNTSAYVGTLTFQGSNDNANWVGVFLTRIDTNSANNASNNTSATNTIFAGPVQFRYLRIRMTSYTSGTAQGTLEIYTLPATIPFDAVSAIQSGSWQIGPGTDLTLIASAAQTTTQTGADQTNSNGRGIRVTLDMTVVTSGPSVTLEIDAKDSASGKYVPMLTGAAVTTISTNVYVIYPGLTPVANSIASDVLPRTWRVKVTANNGNSGTYSVGASYLS